MSLLLRGPPLELLKMFRLNFVLEFHICQKFYYVSISQNSPTVCGNKVNRVEFI
jgi:hypothetical protein